MPINIDAGLPARSALERENIFVMCRERALQQDIRPLRIVIVNLMPTKIETETQLLRLLSNSPLQIDIELLQMASHRSKNTCDAHLLAFYRTFAQIRHERFDGMLITGAPIEHLPFEDVDYWPELCELFAWSRNHVFSTFHICWGAGAGLYYHHGLQKHSLPQKLSGIYSHQILEPTHPLVRGMDDHYLCPHSRYTEVRRQDIESIPDLRLVAWSEEAGAALICDTAQRNIYASGHAEYDRETLAQEYQRDCHKGLCPPVPANYFPHNNPSGKPQLTWRGAASLLFSNWLNYFVYQRTPYDLEQLEATNEP